MKPGPNEKVYPIAKIATVVESLASEGVSPADALAGVRLSATELRSPATRVSANQVLQSYRNAITLSRDPQFAYHTGLKFHVSTYGMYGFSILSSPNFRETIAFAMKYHQLCAPLVEIDFKERDKTAIWTVVPKPYPQIDDLLYNFIVDLQMAIHLSLHRDVMGSSFRPSELHFSSGRPRDGKKDTAVFGCAVLYGQSENRFAFDAHWLDGRPNLGNALTYAEFCQLCDRLSNELQLSAGIAGRVRKIILVDLAQHTSFDSAAKRLKMSTRSLRRKLQDEGTSFRKLIDEVRSEIAIKYLRDTDLSIDDIAYALGFSDPSAFRHAFRRWTSAAPHKFRRARIDRDSSVA
jgi:AraC-like DNA-binding protein